MNAQNEEKKDTYENDRSVREWLDREGTLPVYGLNTIRCPVCKIEIRPIYMKGKGFKLACKCINEATTNEEL